VTTTPATPPPDDRPPWVLRNDAFLVSVTSNWLSMVGLGLLLTALITWLFALPIQMRGHAENPYIGLFVFVAVPMIFFAGLVLVPIGVFLARRRVRRRLEATIADRRLAIRRLVVFLSGATLVNLVVGTQLTYRAVEHMESIQFCGQSCHVMLPEFRAHQNSPHARVLCVECHVAPGAGGWFESKMAGVRQLVQASLGTFPRPIKSGIESGRLVPARETCEQCHWPERMSFVQVRVSQHYEDDEANTPTASVLTMRIGGGMLAGIHGSHFGPGVTIRYAASDGKRQTIPWVQYTNARTGESHTFLAPHTDPDVVQKQKLEVHQMQCVDCHNRPTHAFDLPEQAVDKAITHGDIGYALPFVRKKGVEILKATYASNADADEKIPAALADYYKSAYPDVWAKRADDVAAAGRALAAIYDRNVFPDLGVGWGTYPNNIGHADFPGCFRCHDADHTAADGALIPQDCDQCHELLAVDEKNPDILKTLGIEHRLGALRRP
jgi:hypothetical protein